MILLRKPLVAIHGSLGFVYWQGVLHVRLVAPGKHGNGQFHTGQSERRTNKRLRIRKAIQRKQSRKQVQS